VVKTTAAPVALSRPKLRSTSEKFASRLFTVLLNAGFAVELPVVDTTDEGIPLCWGEAQDSPSRVFAVTNLDPVSG
jgi:hypothetical protein